MTVIENTIAEAITLESNFEKLLNDARTIQDKCEDVIAKANTLEMDDMLQLNGMKLSDYAVSGLCGKLKVPVTYYNRCAENNPRLAAENINNWLKIDRREFMLRKYEDKVRGTLSASYSKFDAPDILKTMDDALDMSKYKLKGSFINEERLHMRVIEKEMLPIEGEDLFAGFTLDSSDIGRSGLKVTFLIWKQVCTNGLVLPKSSGELFRQKHIGITSEEFGKNLIEGFESFEEIKTKCIETIKETKKIPTGDDIEKLAEEIKERTKLTDDVVEEAIGLMNTSYDMSKWGLINAITDVAQKYTLERRLQLEQIAGEMLVGK